MADIADPQPLDAPELWVVRHGATQWSGTGQHTGLTDIPLTPDGEQAARTLAERLRGVQFGQVLTSPLSRARRTAELAGYPDATLEPRAVEWDYGAFEGLTRAQIREQVPDWSAWDHPQMPDGEHLDAVGARADAVLTAIGLRAPVTTAPVTTAPVTTAPVTPVRTLLFAHGHFLRILAARFIGQPARLGEHLSLDPARIGVLSLDRGTPVIDTWNT